MGFLDALNGALGRGRQAGPSAQGKLAESWGLSNLAEIGAQLEALDYDRVQWRKKLKRILEKLPASETEWEVMLTEARALGFDEEWMLRTQIEEFSLMVRRAVADCNVTPEEHRRLDHARTLIGLSEEDGATLVHSIVAEAEAFFGHSVEGA
jgi:hypothetical protein